MQSGCVARSHDMFWPIYIYIFAGANFCSLFLASHHHVYHVQGSSSPGSLSPHSVSWRLPCTSHAHKIGSNCPGCQDPGEGQDGLSCWQMCQCDGLSGMLGWEAHVLLALTMWWWLGWHHMALCGRQTCLLLMSALPHP